MKITVQSIRFDADKKLLAFIEKKVNKLESFSDKIISGQVYLRVEKVEDEANKVTEVKIMLPGGQLFCKEKCKSFEEGVDKAVECLRKQIDKHKQKQAAANEAAKKASVKSIMLEVEDEY